MGQSNSLYSYDAQAHQDPTLLFRPEEIEGLPFDKVRELIMKLQEGYIDAVSTIQKINQELHDEAQDHQKTYQAFEIQHFRTDRLHKFIQDDKGKAVADRIMEESAGDVKQRIKLRKDFGEEIDIDHIIQEFRMMSSR